MDLSEDFLQFVWKYGLFNRESLVTTTGEHMHIVEPGRHNHDAGPDFHLAKIEIGGVLWVGNVEVHTRSQQWNAHRHQTDHAYNNVILHVVWRDDAMVRRSDQTKPWTISLEGRIFPHVLLHYRGIMDNEHWIACERHIKDVDPFHRNKWLDTVLIERLMQKSDHISQLLAETKGDWEKTTFRLLARSFGFKTNALAFDWLAQTIPLSLLAKLKGNNLRIESLIFGQAGFLEQTNFQDAYPKALQVEYQYLQHVYKLKPLPKTVWKFSRLRPNNFPTIRLAQFAAYCIKNHRFYNQTIEIDNLPMALRMFEDLPVHAYWSAHYQFDQKSTVSSTRSLGKISVHNLIINYVIILLFSYGHYLGNQSFMERAIALLEKLPPENNRIVRGFEALGIHSLNAAASQSKLQLKTIYCDQKRCLDCGIGLQVVKYRKE